MEVIIVLIALYFFANKVTKVIKRKISRVKSAYVRGKSEEYENERSVADKSAIENLSVLQGSAYVVDGDTVVLQNKQIRLFGIDAPELEHPYGKQAKWALVELCKGQTVIAELCEQDTWGRTVARCFLTDGRDLSAEMVKLGLAIDWPKFSGGIYRALETPGVRKKLWLANARQKGHMHVWKQFEERQTARSRDV